MFIMNYTRAQDEGCDHVKPVEAPSNLLLTVPRRGTSVVVVNVRPLSVFGFDFFVHFI